ncbi:MAG: ammonium transporter [Bacteroidales bacterium]
MNLSKKVFLSFGLLVVPMIMALGQGDVPVQIDTGITAWMLTSTALVLLMIPGLAMFYGGLVRTKNVIGTMMHSFSAMGIIAILWIAVGYSMSFGPNVLNGWFGWNNDYFFLKGIDESILESGVPEYVFVMFQGKFAIITPALIAGAFAERVTFKGYALFIVLWAILVYFPLCHWVWAQDGFLFNMGVKGAIDFAGGTVVHIASGVSGLVAALYLGPRRGYPRTSMPPSNIVMTLMGAGLLWVGWFGFNAGSSIDAGLVTAQALTATQAAAAAGAITYIFIEALVHGKTTAVGFASGILAGLVAVTPAAGVVTPAGAIALGIAASIVCYYVILLKSKLGYDDSLDAFGVHGIGGIVGSLLLVFFIRESWWPTDSNWGVIDQLSVQAAAVGIAVAYSAVLTLLLVFVVNKTVGLRSSQKEEMQGLDNSYHGEQGYGLLNQS